MVYLKDSNIQVESAAEVAKVFQDLFSLEDPIEQDKEHFYVMEAYPSGSGHGDR